MQFNSMRQGGPLALLAAAALMLTGTAVADPTLPAVGDTATIKYNN